MKQSMTRCLPVLLILGLAVPAWAEDASDDWEKVVFHHQAVVVPSGVSEIARLQIKEGYAYLKP